MEVSVENTGTLGRRIKVSVPDATVKEQIKAKMTKISREAHLKGFRPGKVPQDVLQKKFGPSVRVEVIEDVIRQSLTDIFKSKSLNVAGMPRIEEITDESGKDLEFVATLEVYPEITLANLADVEVEKRTVNISDEDVNKMVAKLQNELADWNNVTREVRSGDKLNVDFSRLLKEPDAKKQEQQKVEMVVGVEGVLPGLTEALLGKNIGETVEAELVYPNDWAETAVAGKAVTLWVVINEIAEKTNLTSEELSNKLGLSIDAKANLTEEVRKRMQEELESALQEELKEKVLEKLLEKNPIEIPAALIDQEKEAIRRELSRQRKVEIPSEAMNQPEWLDQAKRRVELGLLLNEVIKKYNIKANETKIRAEIEKIASRFSSHAKQVIDAYYQNKDLLYGVERMVLLDEAVNVMLGELKQKEVAASFEDVMNSGQ